MSEGRRRMYPLTVKLKGHGCEFDRVQEVEAKMDGPDHVAIVYPNSWTERRYRLKDGYAVGHFDVSPYTYWTLDVDSVPNEAIEEAKAKAEARRARRSKRGKK